MALSLVLGGCPDRPPPARDPYPDAHAQPADGPPTPAPAPAATAEPPKRFVYPKTPTHPPPVAEPSGAGSKVPLQKYIVVDQFGYRPNLPKVAVLVSPVRGWNAGERFDPGPELEVRRWADASVAVKGAPRRWQGGKVDAASGDRGAWFDFSSLKEPGLYYVFDPKNGVRSHPFEIGDGVYLRVLKTAMRMFFFNRANFEKKPPHSCVGSRCWSIAADNVGPGQDREARSVTDRGNPKTARDLSGGWWDAGDTNKYVTFSNDAVHELLTAYTENPKPFGDDFGIPESGNGIPDVIDELVVELEWLKKMQPADLQGGALIKVGAVEHGTARPDQSRLARFYYPGACSSATIVIAGEFAHAALVLRQFPRFAEEVPKLAERARKAWTHFHRNPKNEACDDGTIRSGDADLTLAAQAQAAVVAAVYLFALTGDASFGDYVKQHFRSTVPFQDDRFSVYSPTQGDALLYYTTLSTADPETKQAILEQKRSQARNTELGKFRPELDLYRAYMRTESYHWASNRARAGYGNTSYDFVEYGIAAAAEHAAYVERAAGLLHSFHGVNPMQLVYLTNMYADGGDACADELYHEWFRDHDPTWDNARSSKLGPAPGYLTGGPNAQYCQGQDPKEHRCAESPVREQPPGKAYVDTNTSYEPQNPFDKSWEMTEPGIYYQASYVRLLSKFVD